MSTLYDEFAQELLDWRRRYQGRPEQEMVRLCLLSLEREEIVSVAYHEDVLGRRLAALAVPDEVRALFRQALTWAWRDEEMHAIYIRGALLRLGGPWLRASTFARQAAGALGGWAASVRQHVRWREAPLSRAAATAFTAAGLLLGQVPRDVRRHLRYAPFREFCLFNVEAERTAWLCWKRLAELAPQCPRLPGQRLDDFERVQDDEERHRQVFEILAGALDDEDRLRPGQTAEGLAEQLGAVGEFFLPRSRRRGRAALNPLGEGGPVFVAQGREAGEKRACFRRLLDESGLAGVLAARAKAQGKPLSALRVAIKPTFMLGYDRRDLSMVTDPELLDELAAWLREQGVRRRGGGRVREHLRPLLRAPLGDGGRALPRLRLAPLPAGGQLGRAGPARLLPRHGPVHGGTHLEGGRRPHQLRQDAQPSGGAGLPDRGQRGVGGRPLRPVPLPRAPGPPRDGGHDAARRVPAPLRACWTATTWPRTG